MADLGRVFSAALCPLTSIGVRYSKKMEIYMRYSVNKTYACEDLEPERLDGQQGCVD